MIEGKTILAVIPARGGSKSIPGKNIKPLAGKPLIQYTIEAGGGSQYIDRLICSSDDPEIMETAELLGCEVPFRRPEELARDDTPGVDPVIHAVEILDESYDLILLLQPTSPLRTAGHIDRALELFIDKEADSCVSIREVSEHPLWMKTVDEFGAVDPFLDYEVPPRRQDLPKVYILNGAIYICRTDLLLEEKSFDAGTCVGYIMDPESSVDIDDPFDWKVAEALLRSRR